MKAWAYKDFKIGKLFTAQTGDIDLQQKDINGKGLFFVNSGVEGLGIKGKTDRQAKVFNKNTITIDFWGNAYYRDFDYKMATHNHVFSLSGEVIKNRAVGLYLVSAMSYLTNLFSFNNMGTWSKIKELIIQLPITSTGEIDFAFMQARIQEVEQARIQEMDTYLKVTGFEDCELTDEERKSIEHFSLQKSCPFIIGSLFEIKKGKRLTKDDMIPGEINFIGSTASNNGITAHISNNSHLHDGNKITVSYNGSVGEAFYQSDRFWASDDVNVLYRKHSMNEALALFFCAAFRKSGKKYGYNFKWTKELMESDTISLPVSPSGQIDYKFMETYIRAQEKLAIQRVKNWRAKEIEATKDIVYAKPDQAVQKSVSCYIISSSDVTSSQKYITHLPVYPLRAACGYFDANGSLPEEETEGWIDVSAQMNRLDKGMFIVHAEGQSMEPKIHDGDLCVFNSSAAGSRQGKIVLVKVRDISDPSASSFTIKKYSSRKTSDDDGGWHHTHITLSPLNPNYRSIEISTESVEDGEFKIYGEFVKVINAQ